MSTDRPRRGEESDAELGDDRVRDDEHARDFGDSEPPDPLGQAEPAVTEAHLAEMGPDGPLDDELVDDEPVEGEESAPARRRRRSRAEREERRARQAAAGRAGNEVQLSKQVPNGEPKAEPEQRHHSNEPAHPRKGLFGRAADFLRASYAELRRVQWPDRRQVGQGTAVTLGFVVVAGAYLGLLDAIWNPIIQAIL
jgi:preprotein translocase SecE subunit